MNINQVIEAADKSDQAVAFKSLAGVVIVGLILSEGGNLTFAEAQTGRYMTQGVFYDRYKWTQFERLEDVPEIADHEDEVDSSENEDAAEFPELNQALEWAGDIDSVSDEEVQEYLVEIAGESNHKRNRDTMIKKVAEYVESQTG